MALTWHDISDIFVQIELKLISSLKRNLAGHKAWEKDEGFSWPAWQAEKLKRIDTFRRDNRKIMAGYTDEIDAGTRLLLGEQFLEGAALDQKAADAGSIREPSEENFFGINEPRLNALIDDVTQSEQTAETAALRMMDDVYRRTILQAETAMAAGATTLPQAIDMAVKGFLAAGITCIEYKDGSRHNIADYVQMALRTAATRSYLQGEARRRAELGIDTVLVSQYGACSPTCLPWQGRVYIDDVFGDWHGERRGDMGLSSNGKWYPLLSVAVAAGLFHPNCRHSLSTWYEGISRLPNPLDTDKVEENSALERRQRILEGKVRMYKRMAKGLQQPALVQEYKRKTVAAQKELREFIANHDDVLRRDYWREKTYDVPSVENSSKGDMLTSISTDYLPVTNSGIQNTQLVRGTLLSPRQAKQLRKEHRNLLRFIQEDPPGTEASAAYDVNLNPLGRFKGSSGRVPAPTADQPFIAVHNHPSGNTFAENDVALFIANPQMQILTVVGNNGSTFLLEKGRGYDAAGFIRHMRQSVDRDPGFKETPERYVDFMERLLKGGKAYGVNYFKGKP